MNENKDFDKFNSRENEEMALERIDKEIRENEKLYSFNCAPDKKKIGTRSNSKTSSLILIMALTFVCTFSVLCFTLASMNKSEKSDTPPTDKASQTESQTDAREAGKTVYIKEYDDKSGILTPQQIYSDVIDSVVSIKTRTKTAEGIGSGFVFATNGYIATAEHVVKNAESITVITNDGKEFPAEILATDELCDLALLKTELTEPAPLKFGRSNDLLVGDELIAIGTPASLDFSASMTRGDVSFKDRTVYIYNDESGALEKKMTLIQSSAALNPGNSGGPVFDLYGNVVGIVTMRLGNNFDGISFIIPSDGAYQILNDMMSGTELTDDVRSAVATRAPKLGILGQTNTKADSTGNVTAGVIIEDFSDKQSDAAKKLRLGDVIVSVNSESVKSVSEVCAKINKHRPGESVSVTVLRSSQLLTFVIILGQ